jgi:hypothetical protein
MERGKPREQPSIGRIVHYVSYGTPGGEYEKACRAAIVTEVDDFGSGVGLGVVNPTGIFLNQHVPHDQEEKAGGTWHWPELVVAP